MPNVFFDNPPVLQGDERTQLQQLNGYLYTISNKLNEALMEVEIRETAVMTGQSGTISAEEEKKQQEAYTSLKSMIVKTAEIVRTEMDEISTHLEAQVTALSSQFGTYEQNLESTIRATAEGVLQDYQYEERVTGLEDEAGNTDSFIRKTNQYIFTGLIDPVNIKYGIAVGEGVTKYNELTGEPEINAEAKCATFAMDEMAFWQGETKLAWFASGTFYIGTGQIENFLRIGNFIWKKMNDGSMALISAV